MTRCFALIPLSRPARTVAACRPCLTFSFLLCVLVYSGFQLKVTLDYRNAQLLYRKQQSVCGSHRNRTEGDPKMILFWTKVFRKAIDENDVNNHLFTTSGRCETDRCKVTNNRRDLCHSDAVIFHARGPIDMRDMPYARSPNQRYVLLTKEPPYKTTAIVGYLDYFFNWTATYRVDSDINYRYFQWREIAPSNESTTKPSRLNNRQARAASMVSNCYSESNREDYLRRLESVMPVTRMGYCTGKKCPQARDSCLNQLADTHPFFLAFENSLCRDYVTEKYANVILNSRMIPVVFSQTPSLYIPGSFIDANQFPSPEELGRFLIKLVSNATAYDSYFAWQDKYELVLPDDNDYLCELCRKLNHFNESRKVYNSMKQWFYADAKCQRWTSGLNATVDIPVDETMDYEEPWF